LTGPLEGIRVLDFSHVLAGPFATRLFGDMGADVVKVMPAFRAVGSAGPPHPYHAMWNRNKRALSLDMSTPDGQDIGRRLAEKADVVVDNFAAGVLIRLGIGYEEVSVTNPGVIYLQMSGMGEGGPWSGFVTYAPTIHALAGLTYLTAVPDREDIGIGFSYNDHASGLHGAVAVLAALDARLRTGRGQRIDVSQFETGVNLAGPTLLDLFANGRAARPVANRLPYDDAAPHGVYPCAGAKSDAIQDERWVAIACMKEDQWLALRRVMGEPAWAAELKFASSTARVANLEALDRLVAGWTRTQLAEEVMERCQQAGVPAGVVQNGADMAEADPQLRHSSFLMELDETVPGLPRTFADRLPLHFHATPANVYRRPRLVGEDNATVMSDWLGLPASEVDRLAAEGTLT
jgi:crotonobetainyl-CoA:carnitine CoA-transferase CaiB-like acyl-CoA transferase